MTRPIVTELNVATQETIIREMNDAEFAAHELALEEIAAAEAEAATKAETRAALLERLGITEEEAVLLLGGN
jgi:hypothetical protein